MKWWHSSHPCVSCSIMSSYFIMVEIILQIMEWTDKPKPFHVTKRNYPQCSLQNYFVPPSLLQRFESNLNQKIYIELINLFKRHPLHILFSEFFFWVPIPSSNLLFNCQRHGIILTIPGVFLLKGSPPVGVFLKKFK